MGDPLRDSRASTARKIRYKYASVDEFIRQSSNDISLFGIFIKTNYPWKEGGPFELELQQKDGSAIVHAIGQVIWRREVALSDDLPSGMGIKFLKLDEASRRVVKRAVEARGSAPSRFDRLGGTAARAKGESKGPFPRYMNTLIGIQAVDAINSSKPLSLIPNSYAPTSASSPVGIGKPRYSFVREKPLSVPSQGASNTASLAPRAPTLPQVIPQDAEDIRSRSAASNSIATGGDTGEPTPPLEPTNDGTLRARLAKQQASKPPPAASDHESTRRVERLAELSKAEIREYADPGEQWALEIAEMEKRASESALRSFRRLGMFGPMGARAAATVRVGTRFARAALIQRRRELAIRALLVLLLVGGIGTFWALAPQAWRAAQVRNDQTNHARVTAGVERDRSAEEMVLVEALEPRSEPLQATERGAPKRYLLKVVSQPAGAAVTVRNKRFITPGEVELEKPEGALGIDVRKKKHQPIQSQITATEFREEGGILTLTLDVRLKKLSSNKSRKKPFATTPKRKVSTFHIEPMPAATTFHIEHVPAVPKLSVDNF